MRADDTRDALCVTYFFPPLGGVSVARMTAFVRHLPEAGWRPVILAPRGTAYPLRDPAGLAALPRDLEVIRAPSPEPHGLRRHLGATRRLVDAVRSVAAGQGAPAPAGMPDVATLGVSGSWGGRLAEVRRLLFFPDDQLAWVPFAVAAGLARVRREPPAVIYSTAFPISAHLVAGLIHAITGIPWVAEFRDPWVDNVLAPPMPKVQRQLQRRIERWIVANAARTILVTPGLTAAFVARYPAHAARMRTVMNGYDPDEVGRMARDGGAPPDAADAQVRVVYTGTLDRPRETMAFLSGVERFLVERPEARARLRVELIGRRSPEVEAVVRPMTAADRLGSALELIDFVPRSVALDHVQRATAALVMLGGGPGMSLFVSGKLFDYIGLNRPVLAMVPPGDARGVLETLDWGIVADPEPGSVAAALERLWAGDYRRGSADPDGRFDRRHLAHQLGAVLAEAVEGS